ncbi:hypothetical protein I3U51_12675 [Mycobacteroides abscessus subsp. abscessus]|uniref:hypothetical protein n=1 Tax=Mycobacteroides abscessus TaxID=36809 RepID=UPI0013FD0058|nr:hypothetical protein [Mycobacteroides abscessus]MBN7441381.1 hypothetical protein [Mycobacteroides abscessus subsp. abscessus]
MGDSVAAQRESDRHSVLARGAVGGHPVAVLGAIEGVVERFGVFVPTEAAGVDALATFGPGLLAQVFGTAVAAFVVLVGVVDATGLDGAAGGGEVDVPTVVAVALAAVVDLRDRQRLVSHLAGVDDVAFV